MITDDSQITRMTMTVEYATKFKKAKKKKTWCVDLTTQSTDWFLSYADHKNVPH